jgi:hypothetical protein
MIIEIVIGIVVAALILAWLFAPRANVDLDRPSWQKWPKRDDTKKD